MKEKYSKLTEMKKNFYERMIQKVKRFMIYEHTRTIYQVCASEKKEKVLAQGMDSSHSFQFHLVFI